MKAIFSLIVMGALLTITPNISNAATNVATDLTVIVNEATNITRGSITGSSVKLDATGVPFTYYNMKVSEVLKGSIKPGSRIVIRTLGGPLNSTQALDAGSATFNLDNNVIVLLEGRAADGSYLVHNFSIGKIGVASNGHISGDAVDSEIKKNGAHTWTLNELKALIH